MMFDIQIYLRSGSYFLAVQQPARAKKKGAPFLPGTPFSPFFLCPEFLDQRFLRIRTANCHYTHPVVLAFVK